MLSSENAHSVYRSVKESKHTDQVNKLYKDAIEYAHLRAQCFLVPNTEKSEMGLMRTAAHNVFIDQCNILSRLMSKTGENNSWRGMLGTDRKVIGDFACYLTLFLSLSTR